MTGWIDHDDVGLHWREDGDPTGDPVLLMNSLGTDLRLRDEVLPLLAGLRIIRMDMRGHGLSDAPHYAGVPKADHAIKRAKETYSKMESTP